MKIVLILVLFNFQSGSEVITAEFEDAAACEAAAQRTFQGVDAAVELRPLEVSAETGQLEGTVIVHDAEGNEIGMFSCNPARAEKPKM